MYFGCLQYSEAQDVLCASGERYLVYLRVWHVLVGEYPAVDELLHFVYVDVQASEGVDCRVLPVADYAQKEVVGSNAVAACPHRFFARKIDDGIEFVRYAYFHV